MKEDKENTKPKEKKVEIRSEDKEKHEKVKEKKEVLTKVVIRRLPPSLTKEQLEEQLQPIPEHDYFEFFSSDSSLYPHMFSRVYINFKNPEDIVLFRDRLDGYVFIDSRGQEYPAIVEFAPFQKISKKKSKKKDAKTGTIEDDPEYKKFLESYNIDEEKLTSTPESLLEEIEAKNKELIAKKTTPLLDFLKNRQRIREEKREERRRRELERKRQRDEERRKWREEERRKRKEAEKQKKLTEKVHEKDRVKTKEEPKIKLLKKPEKGEEAENERAREKAKKVEKEKLKEEKSSSGQGSAVTKRPESEVKEERIKRSEEDSRKAFRDKDLEKRQREREKQRRQEEERRKQKEHYEKEKALRRREEDISSERDQAKEKAKKVENAESLSNQDKTEKLSKDEKKEKEDSSKRIRNKDRPAMQLYQPGARSRSRLAQNIDCSGKLGEQAADKKESEEKSTNEKGEE
ncbi:regulator of nonsense transcripts 3B [Latimeria chalumnae]|uniref:regulator of nonsense transcripts 3B n=1 Tax=Latimeria chalumnae TaxID=7897 RepID=UPI0003C148AB|nr:PREDICTED: regulator of nonsense transcripts 3B [Latimeria chalumnae]|eukprot:XP_006003920.1 PREDICTED: regulator of nonsense transcripts 3B [Latimeria chalumnae]